MFSRCAAALTLAVLTTLSFAPGQDAREVVREGKHFRIVFHGAALPDALAATLADESLAAVEGFWPTLEGLLPLRAAGRRTIHLYRDEKEFRRSEASLSPFRFPVEGFVAKQLDGHVWLWPELSAELLPHTGVPRCTVELLLQVAAEQVVTPLLPETDVGGWFRWVLVMGTVESATNPKHLPGMDWGHDDRRHVVMGMRRWGNEISLERLIDPALESRERGQLVWAQACAAVLAEALSDANPLWAQRLLGKHELPRGRVDEIARRRAAVAAIVGRNWEKAEMRFQQLCDRMAPEWYSQVPAWEPGGKRSLLVGTEARAALIVADHPPSQGDYVISGSAEFGPGRVFPVRVSFGWDGKSVVTVSLGEKRVAISVWHTESKVWEERTGGDAAIESGKPFDFRIEVTGRDVRVLIGGVAACAWSHGGRELHFQPQVEVNDRIVWFENLRIEPLAPAKK